MLNGMFMCKLCSKFKALVQSAWCGFDKYFFLCLLWLTASQTNISLLL